MSRVKTCAQGGRGPPPLNTPTIPTKKSRCALLIAPANGTCQNGVRTECQYCIAPPICTRPRRGTRAVQKIPVVPPARVGRATGIFCTAQPPPELTSISSTASLFISPVKRMLCSTPHCSHSRRSPFPDLYPIRGAEPHEKRLV